MRRGWGVAGGGVCGVWGDCAACVVSDSRSKGGGDAEGAAWQVNTSGGESAAGVVLGG